MMYLVEGEPLEWLLGEARHSVECKAAATKVSAGGRRCKVGNLTGPELVEMVGNFVYSETGDYYFADEVVGELAGRLGVAGLVRGESDD